MKFLMINGVCGIRSTGRICTDIADSLTAQGHEVKIAYGRETVPDKYQKYAVKIGSEFGVKLHGVGARLFDAAGFGSKRDTKKFIEWVKEYNPDIIHLHNLHGYYLNLEVFFEYLKECNKKIVWTLHDCWAFTGHSAYCDAAHCEKWKNGCEKCPQIKEYPKSFIDRSRRNWLRKRELMVGINNMTIVTPSRWLADLVKESFLGEYPIEVIHNGIDTSQFFPMVNDFRDVYSIGNKYMILGVASTWNEMKGYSDFLKLADSLGDEYQVVMVGLTDEQMRKTPSNIIGIKRTSSIKELAQLYSAADVFLNLTYCDNYPTVHLEVLCCGTPVISYATGGCEESMLGCGDIVPQGDLKSLISKIEAYRNGYVIPVQFDKTLAENKTAIEQYVLKYSTSDAGGGYWYTKQKYSLVGRRIILGVAAIWDERKGLKYFLKLYQMLDRHNQIILVGLTNEQCKALPEGIIGISRTNSVDELRELYSIADIFVNPTLEDNYPTTNLEAISCGTPVVTFSTGGSPESAEVFGASIDKKDVLGIARLIENPKMTKHKFDFSAKAMVSNYLNVLMSESDWKV